MSVPHDRPVSSRETAQLMARMAASRWTVYVARRASLPHAPPSKVLTAQRHMRSNRRTCRGSTRRVLLLRTAD